jgi:short-subunit dehydrogenase
MAVNYYAPVRLTLAFVPDLIKSKGQIINISALNVLLAPSFYWATYQASKSAFDNWLRCILPELKAKGVTVTSIYLPLVKTRMIEPTEMYRHALAMQAGEAANVICRAIIKRNGKYAPWWTFFPQLLSVILRRQWEFIATQYIKRKNV